MLRTLQLSPVYTALLTSLNHSDDHATSTMPCLILQSPVRCWPFDPQADLVTADGLAQLATDSGLHVVSAPFAMTTPPPTDGSPGQLAGLPDATRPWTLHLPGLRSYAQLATPDGPVTLALASDPTAIESWWRLVVRHRSRCQLLIASGIPWTDVPTGNAVLLESAATNGRLVGAVIPAEL